MFLVALMYALFAAAFTLAKITLSYTTSPLFLIAVRMVIAGIVLLILNKINHPDHRFAIKPHDYIYFGGASLFGIILAFVPEFHALNVLPSIKANLLFSFSPFITAVLAYLVHRQTLTKTQFIGLVIGFCGMIPLFSQGDSLISVQDFFINSRYEWLLMCSVASSAYAWFIINRLMKSGYPLMMINGCMMLFGGMVCSVIYALTNSGTGPVVTAWVPFLTGIGGLILLSNIIGYTMYGTLLRKYSFTLLSFAGFTCPLFGMGYGNLLLNEPLSPAYFVSLAVLVFGLYLFYKEEFARKSVA